MGGNIVGGDTVTATRSGNVYSATIPAFAYGTAVSFHFRATDGVGNSGNSAVMSYTVQDGTAPIISSISTSPSAPHYESATTVTASVTDTHSSISSVTLYYSTNGGSSYTAVGMSYAGGSSYKGVIPAVTYGITVRYYIRAVDALNNVRVSSTTSFFVDDFSGPAISGLSNSVPGSSTRVYATVVDGGSGVESVVLTYYYIWNGDQVLGTPVTMGDSNNDNVYQGTISGIPVGAVVYYTITATDFEGNSNSASGSFSR